MKKMTSEKGSVSELKLGIYALHTQFQLHELLIPSLIPCLIAMKTNRECATIYNHLGTKP